MTAITAVGAYAPPYRLAADAVTEALGRFGGRGVETMAIPGADEDALTLAWEAGRRAVTAGDLSIDSIDFLAMAATAPPLAEEDLTVRLGSMLGVADRTTTQFVGQSTRAGVQAIVRASEHVETTEGTALVIAADAPSGDAGGDFGHAAGAGAAAFVLEPTGPATLLDSATHAQPYPGERYRQPDQPTVDGLGITQYDREAVTTVSAGAVEALAVDHLEVDAAALHAPDGSLPYRIGRSIGLDGEVVAAGTVADTLGDTGAAAVPLGMAAALADARESLLAVGYGSGAGADAVLVRREDDLPVAMDLDGVRSLSHVAAIRRQGELDVDEPAGGGAYVSMPTWRQSLPQRHRLEAGICTACDAVAFPPHGACGTCGGTDGYEPVAIGPTGTVEAVTAVAPGGAPPEFARLQSRMGEYTVAIVDLAGPGDRSASVPCMVADVPDDDLEGGEAVRTVIRRIYTQEGYPRYGRKIIPAE